jgi:hypothetical protein
MRSIKTIGAAALLVLSASVASAQAGRPFHDSWFWGLYGGGLTYAPANANPGLPGNTSVAPIAGADWLITRTHGGLYLGYSQAFMKTSGVVSNGPTSADSGFRFVDIEGMRRVNMIGMLYPGDYLKWHPYLGFGVELRYTADADARGPFTSQKQVDFAASAVNDAKASLGPSAILGIQYRLRPASVFGQATVSRMSDTFLLSNGHATNFTFEFGLRYNLGSSIEP